MSKLSFMSLGRTNNYTWETEHVQVFFGDDKIGYMEVTVVGSSIEFEMIMDGRRTIKSYSLDENPHMKIEIDIKDFFVPNPKCPMRAL